MMDPKFLLLFVCVAVASNENCVWTKQGAYLGMISSLFWFPDREAICDSINMFNKEIENSTCYGKEEINIFKAFNESCDSKCNLFEVVNSGKYVAFQLSLNTEKHSACVHFPYLKHLLKKHNCEALHAILLDLMVYCDQPPRDDVDLSVNLNTEDIEKYD